MRQILEEGRAENQRQFSEILEILNRNSRNKDHHCHNSGGSNTRNDGRTVGGEESSRRGNRWRKLETLLGKYLRIKNQNLRGEKETEQGKEKETGKKEAKLERETFNEGDREGIEVARGDERVSTDRLTSSLVGHNLAVAGENGSSEPGRAENCWSAMSIELSGVASGLVKKRQPESPSQDRHTAAGRC